MANHRIERINDQLRAEIADLIIFHMKDPRLHGMISVTFVETAPDLSRAKVHVSILGEPEDRDETLATLQRAAGFFRHELRARLHLKRTPELELRLDTSIERGARIMQLLRQVQDAPGGVSPADHSGTKESDDDRSEDRY